MSIKLDATLHLDNGALNVVDGHGVTQTFYLSKCDGYTWRDYNDQRGVRKTLGDGRDFIDRLRETL